MGLHLNYELSLASDMSPGHAAALVWQLHHYALDLPFDAVSDVIHLRDHELGERPELQGLGFRRLEDVARLTAFFTREELYTRAAGIPESEIFERVGNDIYVHPVDVPADLPAEAYGFGIAVGHGSEPAALGIVRVSPTGYAPSPWWWRCYCKTQYASVHGDDNLVRCHLALVAALETAQSLGFAVTVHDETGYWESRDAAQLVRAVTHMNRLIASFAGQVTDAVRDAGADSRGIEAEIFKHPDFERLEMPDRD